MVSYIIEFVFNITVLLIVDRVFGDKICTLVMGQPIKMAVNSLFFVVLFVISGERIII